MWAFDLSAREALNLMSYRSLKSLRSLRESSLVAGYHFVVLNSRKILYSEEKLKEFLAYGRLAGYSAIVARNLQERDRLLRK